MIDDKRSADACSLANALGMYDTTGGREEYDAFVRELEQNPLALAAFLSGYVKAYEAAARIETRGGSVRFTDDVNRDAWRRICSYVRAALEGCITPSGNGIESAVQKIYKWAALRDQDIGSLK